MAKVTGKLASRYARALLRAVIKDFGNTGSPTMAQQLAASFSNIASIWEQEKSFSTSILNPMFAKEERLAALLEIARIYGMPEIGIRFLTVLFERDRVSALPEVAHEFSLLADQAAGMLQVDILTARGIPQEERESIQATLQQRMSGNLNFIWNVDPALLGGMVVRYGGKVLDGSLRGRLERIEKALVG